MLPLLLTLSLAAPADKNNNGSLAVETIDTLTLKDARKKDLAVKVYHPKSAGSYPLIVFSHGFGGNKDAFGPVARHWASHGYVVVHPSHADGFGKARDKTEKAERPLGLVARLSDPAKIANRVADVVLVLDSIVAHPKLKSLIDKDKIGVAGHSYGAYTTMLIGGVTVDLGSEKAKSFVDKRVKCIMPISAQGTGQQGLTDKSWQKLKVPMLVVTGTRDQGAGGQGVDWKKEPFKHSPPGDKYLLVIEGANHMSFGGGLGARSEDATSCVKLAGVEFWDAYLKGSEAAKKFLTSGQLVKTAKAKCVFEKK